MKKILLLVCCFFTLVGMENPDDEGYVADCSSQDEREHTKTPAPQPQVCDQHCPQLCENQLRIWDKAKALHERASQHHHKLIRHATNIKGNQAAIEVLCKRDLAQDARLDSLEQKILTTQITQEKFQKQCSRLTLLLDTMEQDNLNEEPKECDHCSGIRQVLESYKEQQDNRYRKLLTSVGFNTFVILLSYLVKAGCAYSEKCPAFMQ